jgi:hypothetical protein
MGAESVTGKLESIMKREERVVSRRWRWRSIQTSHNWSGQVKMEVDKHQQNSWVKRLSRLSIPGGGWLS